MAIWVISKYASVPKFGRATRQFYLAKHFHQITKKQVSLVASRSVFTAKYPSFGLNNHCEYNIDGISVNILNGPIINGGFNILRFWSWLVFEIRLLIWGLSWKREKPDLIIVSSLSLLTVIAGLILKFRYKAKMVFEVRDIYPLTLSVMKNWSKKHPVIFLLGLIEKLGYAKSDYIVGTMPNLKSHVNQVSSKNSQKVFCIPMGIDESFFEKEISENGEDIFLDFILDNKIKDKFIVGYAGTLGKVNCIDQIIVAASYIESKDIVFLILGNGPEKEKMIKLKEELKLDNVFFHPEVSKSSVLNFLECCNVLLHPVGGGNHLYDYGVSPNKWIDYMNSARPIIVSYNGFKSIINEANCGLFIEADNPKLLASTISEMAKLPKETLDEMGMNGKNYLLKNLTYSQLAKKYLEKCDYSFC
jgi:glycosyltransferase involved in cell wall biosynthesis